jgi:hypothetical protein
MSPEESNIKPDTSGEAGAKKTQSPSPEPSEPPESNKVASLNQGSANKKISSNSLAKPLIQKSTTAAQSDNANEDRSPSKIRGGETHNGGARPASTIFTSIDDSAT